MSIEKWTLKELSSDSSFIKSAKVTLKNRLGTLLDKISIYLSNPEEENLHQVRIAIRRVRYSLEVFSNCFSIKDIDKFYRKVESLQDKTGIGRDLDVIQKYISGKVNSKRIVTLIDKINKDKIDIESNIKLELMKFFHSKLLKKILNIIK
ncbi:MAG TPA: CHAD domain-containing protein [Ignavibacteriaceae bacterium]|nr:CHAD domain-containing protein [Ignavibacteriaceae bacterium]